ncbi:MAG TPA: YceI family protein [Casimicrobiaceae bacterium]|jgi:polyisoprenoid-binding protein YceI|nr:YceI family protein [Casimicrobiaceae bacterium]
MKVLRSFIPSLAMLLLAAGQSGAQGLLIDKSEIRFVSKQMGVNVEGRFRKWKANVVFLPKDLAKSKAEFEIDLGSIDLASDESETEIKSSNWFDTAKFPVARFASTSFRSVGSDKYEVMGKLTMKGITREVVIPIALKKDANGNSVAEGSFPLKRTDYKVGEGMWSDTDMVADDVLVRIRMVLPRVA